MKCGTKMHLGQKPQKWVPFVIDVNFMESRLGLEKIRKLRWGPFRSIIEERQSLVQDSFTYIEVVPETLVF